MTRVTGRCRLDITAVLPLNNRSDIHTEKCIKNSKKLIGAFENVCLKGAL